MPKPEEIPVDTSSDLSNGKKFGKASASMFKNLKSTVSKGIAAARSPNTSSFDLKTAALSQEAQDQRENLEEIAKFICEDQDFYMCPNLDVTKTLSRLPKSSKSETGLVIPPKTKSSLSSSFAWNSHMWSGLTSESKDLQKWSHPLLRGHISQKEFDLTIDENLSLPIVITLISRRSRHRAGMRYGK